MNNVLIVRLAHPSIALQTTQNIQTIGYSLQSIKTDARSSFCILKKIRLNENVNENNKLQDNYGKNYLTMIPPEILRLIIGFCEVSEIISLSQTCRSIYITITSFDVRWKTLCAKDFDVHLNNKSKFMSYYDIYRLLYCSRILLGAFIYARYYNKVKVNTIPPWLLVWAHLSFNPPLMKYGRKRIKRRINGSYLKRLNDISHGQLRKVFDLKEYSDLMNLYPVRSERGTIYFSWFAVKFAGARKHGSLEKFHEHILNKCHRSRGFVERNYAKIRGSDPLLPL